MKLSVYPIPMPSQNKWSPNATTYNCKIHVMGDLLDITNGLQIFELKLASRWSWANQGIPFVDLIHLGAYKLIELDIYAYVACYEVFELI